MLLGDGEQVLVQCIPVRWHDDVVAVVARETRTTLGRQLGELEHHYLDLFERFARMITQGSFPFRQDDDEFEDAPRVGDGVILVDPDLRVRFASPNAVSSLHRMGIHSYTSGLHLAEMGFDQDAVDVAMRARLPVTEEVEHGDTSVLVQAIPLLEEDAIVGVLVLLRDVTDLRRRDRMLVSKDATIREIHHRVKNNLQTIAALLRLQGRHLQSPEARAALEESERRIRAIAVVHETLSRDPRDVVLFDDIVRPLVRVVQETVASPDADLRFEVDGDAGYLPGRPRDSARGRAQRADAERGRPRLPAGDDEQLRGRVRSTWRGRTASSSSTSTTTASGSPTGSRSKARTDSACRSCTRSSPPSSMARSCSPAARRAAPTSTCRSPCARPGRQRSDELDCAMRVVTRPVALRLE